LQDKALSEIKAQQQEELAKLEALLKQERDQRVAAEEKNESEKLNRREQKKLERQRIIEEAVNAAKNVAAAAAATQAELISRKLGGDVLRPPTGDLDASSSSSEDDGEFFQRPAPKQEKASKPVIESFMSVSKQHTLRGFGIVGGKQSQASAFEDDDDVSPVAPPRRAVPVDEKPLIVPPVEPEGVRLPSAI